MYCGADKCVSGSKDARAVRPYRRLRHSRWLSVAKGALAGNGHAMARPYLSRWRCVGVGLIGHIGRIGRQRKGVERVATMTDGDCRVRCLYIIK
jgi:hypothetical protein